MRTVIQSFVVVLVALILGCSFSNADEGWYVDAAKAIARAKEDDRDLLLLYTGSDWCPPCKKLEEEVFGVEGFMDEATRKFVLVKFDFPKQLELPDGIKEQNAAWADKYGVASYPTVILVDRDLLPYAITGYEPGGVENYLGKLEEYRQLRVERDRLFAAADKAEGTERAKLLDQAISGMDEQIVTVYYEKIVATIVELDKDDELGLRSKWNEAKDAELRKVIMADILMISRLEKPARALSFIDEVVSEIKFPADEMLIVMQLKLTLVRKLNDNGALDALLDEMISLEGVEGETKERLIVKKIFLMVGTGRRPAALKLLEETIAGGGSNLYLHMAKSELQAAVGDFTGSVESLDKAISSAGGAPDILVELVGAKADSLFELKDVAGALQVLDNFADDTQMPSDLRSEAMLHKSMIMRDSGRKRQARLAENRAVEIAESPKEKAEMQKIVERLRKKYDE